MSRQYEVPPQGNDDQPYFWQDAYLGVMNGLIESLPSPRHFPSRGVTIVHPYIRPVFGAWVTNYFVYYAECTREEKLP